MINLANCSVQSAIDPDEDARSIHGGTFLWYTARFSAFHSTKERAGSAATWGRGHIARRVLAMP